MVRKNRKKFDFLLTFNIGDGTNDAIAQAMYVSGRDVYVAGHEYIVSKLVATVWKNGAATSLTNGTNNANVWSLFVVE